MSPREVLVAARALLATPDRWTQAALARDAEGVECEPTNPRAVCRCAEGALVAAAQQADAETWGLAGGALCEAIGDPVPPEVLVIGVPGEESEITVWNDAPERTHAAVLAAFDCAIEATP